MKKIFVILTSAVICCACNENRIPERLTNEPIPWREATEFEYKGHSYIKFSGGYQGATVHDPDCKCFKKVEINE